MRRFSDRLGAKLAEIAPGDIATAFFTDSGSEANEIAMTIARLVTRRRSLGLLACVELVTDGMTRQSLSAKFGHGDSIEWIKRRVLELGLEVRVNDHFILIGPPLSITAQEIAWAMSVFDEILAEVEGQLVAA